MIPLQPGMKIKLSDLTDFMKRATLVKNHPAPEKITKSPTQSNEHKPLPAVLDSQSKSFYQNCCAVASGKCERCRAPDCRDRDWRIRA